MVTWLIVVALGNVLFWGILEKITEVEFAREVKGLVGFVVLLMGLALWFFFDIDPLAPIINLWNLFTK